MQTTGTVCTDVRAVDVLQVDHRVPLVRLALGTGVDARLAADAAVRVDEELHLGRTMGISVRRLTAAVRAGRRTPAPSALRMRTAQTLYSGIFEIGSWAAIVTRLTLLAPAQWYGTNTTSGRIVVTTWQRIVRLPRRISTVTQSPSAMPCLLRQDRVQLQQRLRVLVHQRADPPRLVAATGTCSPPGRWSG